MWTRKSSLPSSSGVVFPNIPRVVVAVVCIFGQLAWICQAQSSKNATTDPLEVQIINSVFRTINISADTNLWNISGEPCSGAATNSTPFTNQYMTPLIKCDCSYNDNTTCHITHLTLGNTIVDGTIPDELWNLTYLVNLDLSYNRFTGSLSPAIGNLTQLQYLNVSGNALSGEIPAEIWQLTELKSL